jgi:hypothetical protein
MPFATASRARCGARTGRWTGQSWAPGRSWCARQTGARSGRAAARSRDRFGALRDDLGRKLVGTSLAPGSYVRSGFLEGSNVDAVGEMVNVLEAERSFETAQKVLSAIDQTARQASAKMSEFK